MAMELRKREGFVYNLPTAFTTPPRNSIPISKKSPAVESRHDRAKRKHDEWTHDAQPPFSSSFYPSSESNNGLKNKILSESVPDSQEEIDAALCSPKSGGRSRGRRVVSRLTYNDSPENREAENGIKTTGISIRMLESNIHENRVRVEEIKERRHHTMRQIKALTEQVYNDDNYIRTIERTTMQFESQRERILTREFERNMKRR